MPLVYQQNINESAGLGVWHITEDESFFLHKVSLLTPVSHAHKRLQHLAGRYLLKELFPQFPTEHILIADNRKPYLADELYHFSLSHCGDYAAAIISRSQRVGIDIELPQKKVEALSVKFLSSTEAALIQLLPANPIQNLTAAWSIKEALFKWYGHGALDFKKHMHILKVSYTQDFFTAKCAILKGEKTELTVTGTIIEDNLLTWVVQ